MQQQFNLPKTLADVNNYNSRAEKHGKKKTRPAGTLKLTVAAHSKILDFFGPGYRPFLFRKPVAGEQQTDDLTEIANPKLQTLRLSEKFPGYKLQLESGLELSEPQILENVELSEFLITPIKGGAVKLVFNVNLHPDSKQQAGELCFLINNKAEVTLTPPGPAAQGSLDLSASGGDSGSDEDEDADDESANGEATPEESAAEVQRLSNIAAGDKGGEEE